MEIENLEDILPPDLAAQEKKRRIRIKNQIIDAIYNETKTYPSQLWGREAKIVIEIGHFSSASNEYSTEAIISQKWLEKFKLWGTINDFSLEENQTPNDIKRLSAIIKYQPQQIIGYKEEKNAPQDTVTSDTNKNIIFFDSSGKLSNPATKIIRQLKTTSKKYKIINYLKKQGSRYSPAKEIACELKTNPKIIRSEIGKVKKLIKEIGFGNVEFIEGNANGYRINPDCKIISK